MLASHAEAGDGQSRYVTLDRERPTDTTVKLAPVVGLFGLVTDATTGQALADASVAVSHRSADDDKWGHHVSVRTDPRGQWWCVAYDAAPIDVTTSAGGHCPERAPLEVSPHAPWHRLNVALEPELVLNGRLIDASGAPVDVAEAVAAAAGGNHEDSAFALVSEEDPATVPNFLALRRVQRGFGHEKYLHLDGAAYSGTVTEAKARWVSVWYGLDTLLGSAAFDRHHVSPDIVIDTSVARPPPARDAVIRLLVVDGVTGSAVSTYSARAHLAAIDSTSLVAEFQGELSVTPESGGRIAR